MKRVLMLLIAIVFQLSACGQDLLRSAASRTAGLKVPPDCNRPNLLANGYPVMVPARNGVDIGISLAQHEFKSGEPIELHIWVDNTGDSPASVFTCWDLDLFKRIGFQIFSQKGHRILSRNESKAREECSTNPESASHWGGPVACARNIMFSIPAHTCITRDSVDFATELTGSYELPPGNYFIRLRTDRRTGVDLCKPGSKAGLQPGPTDLKFTVLPAPGSSLTR